MLNDNNINYIIVTCQKKLRRRCERRFRKHFKIFLHELNIAITIRKRNKFIKIKKLNIAMILIMRHEFENKKNQC